MNPADVIPFLIQFFQVLGNYLAQAVGDPIKAAVFGLILIAAGYMGRALTALGIGLIAVSLILYALSILAH